MNNNQSKEKFLTRVMLKILNSIIEGKPSVYAQSIVDSNKQEGLCLPTLKALQKKTNGIFSDKSLSFLKSNLENDKSYSILLDAAEDYLKKRIERYKENKEKLQKKYLFPEYRIEINLEGCSDCCSIIKNADQKKLFVKTSKQDSQIDEMMINFFIGNILRKINKNLAAKSSIITIDNKKYLVSENAEDIFRGRKVKSKFIEGLEYITGEFESAIQQHLKKNHKGDFKSLVKLFNYLDEEDLLSLGMMSMIFSLADCHGHNIGVVIENYKTDETRLKNRVVTFDLAMHKQPKKLREISENETLVNYFCSNIQRYYNNAFLRYITQTLKDPRALARVDDHDVVRSFLKIKNILTAMYLPSSAEIKYVGKEFDECGLRLLIKESIQKLGEPKQNVEKECLSQLNSNINIWLSNYRTIKKTVMKKCLKPQDDLSTLSSQTIQSLFFSQSANIKEQPSTAEKAPNKAKNQKWLFSKI